MAGRDCYLVGKKIVFIFNAQLYLSHTYLQKNCNNLFSGPLITYLNIAFLKLWGTFYSVFPSNTVSKAVLLIIIIANIFWCVVCIISPNVYQKTTLVSRDYLILQAEYQNLSQLMQILNNKARIGNQVFCLLHNRPFIQEYSPKEYKSRLSN